MTYGLSSINDDGDSDGYMGRRRRLKGHQMVRTQLYGGQLVAVVVHATHVVEPRVHSGEFPSSGDVNGGSWSQHAHLDLLFKMVPSVLDESAQIVDTYFCAKIETLQVDPCPTEPCFDVMIPNSYS